MNEFIVWLIISIALIVVDGFTSSFLLVWFGVAGFVAALLSALGVSIGVQIAVFLILGSVLAVILYPIAKQKFKVNEKTLPLREETYIGKVLEAEDDIKDKTSVKIDGVLWNAINKGEPIKKGQKMKVIGLDGNKIIVKKIEEEN